MKQHILVDLKAFFIRDVNIVATLLDTFLK